MSLNRAPLVALNPFVHVFMTGEEVSQDGDAITYGWVEPSWSRTTFHDHRNDAGSVFTGALAAITEVDVLDLLDQHLGAWTDNGDGSIMAIDTYDQVSTGKSFRYTLHFIIKYLDPTLGYVEKAWPPFEEEDPS